MIIEVKSETDTKALGEKLGAFLKGGEVLQLVGDVGAGKTTFVKGLAKGLGIDEDVQSPSFTISRVYDGRDNLQLIHYDFYRLTDPGIMALELNEAMHDPQAITVIEWADSVAELLPHNHWTLSFVPSSETARTITVPDEFSEAVV